VRRTDAPCEEDDEVGEAERGDSGEEAGEGVKDLRVRNVCGDFGLGFNAVLDPCLANAM